MLVTGPCSTAKLVTCSTPPSAITITGITLGITVAALSSTALQTKTSRAMAKVILFLSVVVLCRCFLVSCKHKPPGHVKPHPMPPPPMPRPSSRGFEEYKNRTIEENANKGVHFYLIGGDIRLTPGQQLEMELTASQNDPYSPMNAVINNDQLLWPNGQVPYIFHSSLSSSAIEAIREAIQFYESNTCVNFQLHTTEEDYVQFFEGDGCYSYIGRIGGEQDISIGRGCEYAGIVMHEIFHLLGRWHEQSRPDRDAYVTIINDNIKSGFESNFEKVSSSISSTQGVPYDYGSVMHYGAYAFSTNGEPTIHPSQSSISLNDLGQRQGLSDLDLEHVRVLYCSGADSSVWSSWSSWSSCSRSCNTGVRRRMRTCNGGYSCSGSNIDTDECNTQRCRATASWSKWSEWSGCSASCGTGRQSRQRRCENGDSCSGRTKQFQDCNTDACEEASSWGNWRSWSTCSKTCQGGTRFRNRRCLNGNQCEGSSVDAEYCNSDVSCNGISSETGEWSEWSVCTAECGGGTRFRTRTCAELDDDCATVESETCNSDDCDPEPQLDGIEHVGCYFIPTYSKSIFLLEGETTDLSDNPRSRRQPIRKCGSAARKFQYVYFSIAVGYCISGSNNLIDYQIVPSRLCQDGVGGYYARMFLMDVYHIVDTNTFDDSVDRIISVDSTTVMPTSGASHQALSVIIQLNMILCCIVWVLN